MVDRIGPRGPGIGRFDLQGRLRERSHPIAVPFRPITPAEIRSIAAKRDPTEVSSFLAPRFSSPRVLRSLQIDAQLQLMELMALSLAKDSRSTVDRVVFADNQDIVGFAKTHDLELYPIEELANSGGGARIIAIGGGEFRPRAVFVSQNDRKILAINWEIDQAVTPESGPYVISKVVQGDVLLNGKLVPAAGVLWEINISRLTQEVLADLVFAADDPADKALENRLTALLDFLLARFMAESRSENSPTYFRRVARAVFLFMFDPLVPDPNYRSIGQALFEKYWKTVHPEDYCDTDYKLRRYRKALREWRQRHPETVDRQRELRGLLEKVVDDNEVFSEDVLRRAPFERRTEICRAFGFSREGQDRGPLARKLFMFYQPPPTARVTQAASLVPPVVKNPLAFLIMPMVPPPEQIELVPGRGTVIPSARVASGEPFPFIPDSLRNLYGGVYGGKTQVLNMIGIVKITPAAEKDILEGGELFQAIIRANINTTLTPQGAVDAINFVMMTDGGIRTRILHAKLLPSGQLDIDIKDIQT